MPNIAVVDMQGKSVGTMELSEEIFAIEPNTAAMHLVVRSYLAAQRQGTQSALSAQFSDGNIIVVDEIKLAQAKTKLVAQMLKALNADKKVLLVVPQEQKDVVRASKNLPKVKDAYVNTINVYDLLKADKIVVAKAAMQAIQEVYA